MFTQISPAFEFLRQHKKVSPEVEILFKKQQNGKYSESELLECFEKGISGEYGHIYTLDVQTLTSWVRGYNSLKMRLGTGSTNTLIPAHSRTTDTSYPQGAIDWMNECNKAYTSFLSTGSTDSVHPDVQSYLVTSSKIPVKDIDQFMPNGWQEYFNPLEPDADFIICAKRKSLLKYFTKIKKYGHTKIFNI